MANSIPTLFTKIIGCWAPQVICADMLHCFIWKYGGNGPAAIERTQGGWCGLWLTLTVIPVNYLNQIAYWLPQFELFEQFELVWHRHMNKPSDQWKFNICGIYWKDNWADMIYSSFSFLFFLSFVGMGVGWWSSHQPTNLNRWILNFRYCLVIIQQGNINQWHRGRYSHSQVL